MSATHEAPGLEILMREAMDRAKAGLPPDVGLTVFVWHKGRDGYIAYGSNGTRETMVEAIVEWLFKWARDEPANLAALRTFIRRHS